MERTRETIFTKDYMPYIINRGKWCTRLVLLVAYLPVLVLLFYFDAHPTTDSIFTGMVSMLSILLPWYIVDPISLQSIFGTPGMYLSYMAGNTKEVRVPASTQALNASGYQLGTPEGTIISAIGIAVSTFISLGLMTFLAVAGQMIIKFLPQTILDALQFLLPSLFGALFMDRLLNSPMRLSLSALPVIFVVKVLAVLGIFTVLPFGGGYASIIICVIACMLLAKFTTQPLKI
ncbi:hypothetical protein NGK12_10990 [Raoultella ornithinolytica]|uniref:hypothetical protein n=1 Tax=Raoultella ornithinolytica TaxID=54291 RepID=UPI0010EE0A9A|nr:hypothetical protein [Raoultella ornithinolytica]ELB6484364.1 hypothetical protein [Raoultella ornithinolytica]MEB7861090.1 hypothetical protein [Raoultella ornithinolytica]MEB7983255.1 hypothetical protein [Raoultella ornithinolytica]VTN51200.1 Uncharacterised protein [Raoultella ornithinolytica]HCT7942756.1 hypothetical protein [Raoultella ornithinolytica]